MSDTIELVRFRLQKGKTEQEWLKANETINEWLARQPGFRFRSLSEAGDGEWIDLIHWESREAAETADNRILNEIGGAFEAIAEESIVCTHSKAHLMLRAGAN